MDTPKGNGAMPHATHGSNVFDEDDWVFVDEDKLEEILRLLRRCQELVTLVLGLEGSDQGDIETCFGTPPK